MTAALPGFPKATPKQSPGATRQPSATAPKLNDESISYPPPPAGRPPQRDQAETSSFSLNISRLKLTGWINSACAGHRDAAETDPHCATRAHHPWCRHSLGMPRGSCIDPLCTKALTPLSVLPRSARYRHTGN
jgi:hypothetical protein